jgi:hypothetical protein
MNAFLAPALYSALPVTIIGVGASPALPLGNFALLDNVNFS